MAVTRLKRKAKRNKSVAKKRVETIQRLNAKPVIKQVDLDEIKEGFGKSAPKKSASEKPVEKVVKDKKATDQPKEEAPKAKKEAKKAAAGDDLKKIEGIGPKIAEIFNDEGIDSFAALAATPVNKLKEILENAGSRYRSHDPTTWPKQAGLAAEGKWDELKTLQDELDGGK